MTLRRSAARDATLPQAVLLVVLALVVLAPTLFGRAGFMLIDPALAERIFPLHQHGVPGEAEYIRAFGVAAPFIHPHCHRPPAQQDEHTPTEFGMAALVFGPLLCGEAILLPAAPVAALPSGAVADVRPNAARVLPVVPPPQG